MIYLLIGSVLFNVALLAAWFYAGWQRSGGRPDQDVLQASEELYRVVAENATDILWTMDLKGCFTFVNSSVKRVLGYEPEDALAMAIADILTPEAFAEGSRLTIEYERLHRPAEMRGQKPLVLELEHVRADDTLVWCEINLRFLVDEDGTPRGYIGVTREISERKKTEAQLLSYQKQLREMASQMSLVAERERHTIAEELHDRIGQTLAVAKIQLQTLHRSAADKQLADSLRGSIELVDQTMRESRSLTFELSPPILYEFGLVAATEWYLEKMEQRYGIRCTFVSTAERRKLNDEYRLLLFRVVRELLHNVIKHAQADRIDVTVRTENDRLLIEIADDGIGFVPESLNERYQDADSGFGLFSVRERIEYLNGNVTIDSQPGTGTRVVMDVPFSAGFDPEWEGE
ncbi:MAG: PAS domain-containing sensor histidine kinase [Candidatus Lernaella stagnicola]|nr:PAS domain-containing sensor histidine kinase [Candidatus Lernaella stagnicola]